MILFIAGGKVRVKFFDFKPNALSSAIVQLISILANKLYRTFLSYLRRIFKTQLIKKTHSTCKRSHDCSDCFVFGCFFSFYFLNALQSDINSNGVYFLGHKYVLGLLRARFNPRLAARAKMSLSRAPKYTVIITHVHS